MVGKRSRTEIILRNQRHQHSRLMNQTAPQPTTTRFSLPFLAATVTAAMLLPTDVPAKSFSDADVSNQRAALAKSTDGAGFGPQAPRDIESTAGANPRAFSPAPPSAAMNLCNIHMHKSAEHKGGEFTRYAGNGDGKGYGTGFVFSGDLTANERKSLGRAIGKGKGSLQAGDTIEVHYVYSSARVKPGPTLGACLSDSIKNPQLRVEAQVYVLVNDANAQDFMTLTKVTQVDDKYQAINIPSDTGSPVQYAGSTTGPSYNQQGSPFQVSWSVRPKVTKVNIASVESWFANNVFDEAGAHAVRNLVVNPSLLSEIK